MKLPITLLLLILTGVTASRSSAQKPCPVLAEELDICTVIANAMNYDGKEITVGGTAKIRVTDWFLAIYSSHDSSRVLRTSQTTVSAPAVQRFLQKVEDADFWSMPSDIPIPVDSSGRRKFYVMDADRYVFEGVRSGKYHVVMRSWQDAPEFAEMVDSLVMDLARLRGSAIPTRPAFPQH